LAEIKPKERKNGYHCGTRLLFLRRGSPDSCRGGPFISFYVYYSTSKAKKQPPSLTSDGGKS